MTTNKVNLFIVGAAKCGTSSLVDFLAKEKSFFFSVVKEPFFFIDEFGIKSLEEYHSLYKKAFGKYDYIGDASTGYLYDPSVANKIHMYNKDAKVIILIRNPCHAAVSLWRYMQVNGEEKLSFSEAIKNENVRKNDDRLSNWNSNYLYSERYQYSEQILSYLTSFPKSNILVIIFERLIDNPSDQLTRLSFFLGVEFESHVLPFSNQGGVARNEILRKIKNCRYPLLRRILPAEVRYKIRMIARDIITVKKKNNNMVKVPDDFKQKIKTDVVKLKALINDDIPEWDIN